MMERRYHLEESTRFLDIYFEHDFRTGVLLRAKTKRKKLSIT